MEEINFLEEEITQLTDEELRKAHHLKAKSSELNLKTKELLDDYLLKLLQLLGKLVNVFLMWAF